MSWKTNKIFFAFAVIFLCVLQYKFAACYKSEIEITPSPIEEPTTKKSGFFSGFKNLFRGSTTTTTVQPDVGANTPTTPKTTTTTTVNTFQKPPPLVIAPKAPLMPLGPRPDTPPTSPLSGNQHQAPVWPEVGTSTTARPIQMNQPLKPDSQRPNAAPQFPNFPQGVKPYNAPSKSQPSGLDLSYGNSAGSRPQGGTNPSFGLAPISSTTKTSTSTTTPRNKEAAMNFDLRGGFGTTTTTTTTTTRRPQQEPDNFPSLSPQRKPSTGAKEDFPPLPTPKSPTGATLSTTIKPSSPSAWNVPNTPNNNNNFFPGRPNSPATSTSTSGGNGVSFVPHKPDAISSTTVRTGFENTGNNLATDVEIMELTETLYTKENSHLSEIHINLQGKTRSIDSTDEAPQKLLEIDSKFKESPTMEKMRLLFNNYDADTSINEHVSANEHKEENDFVDAIMATSVMRQAMIFLQNKGIVSPDPKTHRDLVKEIWFTQYSRGAGKIGSSGFEHVFLHEVKNGTIIGFHNWLYFAEEEKAGRMDYKGYLKEMDIGTKGKVVKMRFTHNGLNKPVNGLFIGTTPELELALYTICFKVRPDRTCPVSLGNSKFSVVTYSWRYRGKNLIGSAFPEL